MSKFGALPTKFRIESFAPRRERNKCWMSQGRALRYGAKRAKKGKKTFRFETFESTQLMIASTTSDVERAGVSHANRYEKPLKRLVWM